MELASVERMGMCGYGMHQLHPWVKNVVKQCSVHEESSTFMFMDQGAQAILKL